MTQKTFFIKVLWVLLSDSHTKKVANINNTISKEEPSQKLNLSCSNQCARGRQDSVAWVSYEAVDVICDLQ